MRFIGYGIALALVALVLINYSKDKGDPEGVIPAGYERSLEKAKEVEQTLQNTAEGRLQDMESGQQ